MRNRLAVVLATCLTLGLSTQGALTSRAAAQEGEVPTYATAELVALDPVRRVVVVKNSEGARVTYLMDDLLAGAPGVKPGDRVIITLRGSSGAMRVSAITRAKGPSAMVVVAKTPSLARLSTSVEPSQASVKDAFARQVALLSENARPIDTLWASFVTDCKVQPVSANDGRAWFGLWDGRVQADYSNGSCRDLFNQIVAAGEVIKQGMSAAEDAARKTLTPGDIRDIRRVNLMEWDGWSLRPPQRREP